MEAIAGTMQAGLSSLVPVLLVAAGLVCLWLACAGGIKGLVRVAQERRGGLGVLGLALLVFGVSMLVLSGPSRGVWTRLRGARLKVGAHVEVVWSPGVNVWRLPGHKDKHDVCGWIAEGQSVQLLAGPVFQDGAWWWKIENSRCGGEGWVSETREVGGHVQLDTW